MSGGEMINKVEKYEIDYFSLRSKGQSCLEWLLFFLVYYDHIEELLTEVSFRTY